LVVFSSSLLAAAPPTKLAGEITELRGEAWLAGTGDPKPLAVHDRVFAGDFIHTATASRVKLKLLDDSVVTLGAQTQFIVEDFSYYPGANVGHAALRLVKGFFRAVTGKITQNRNAFFEVRAPLAIIGVRGTDFWGEQSDKKMRVALIAGSAVEVRNQAGAVVIDQPGYGTEVVSATAPPRAPFKWSDDAVREAMGTVD
jgi:hypothetical protein